MAPDVSSNEDDFKSVRPLEDMEESANSKPVIGVCVCVCVCLSMFRVHACVFEYVSCTCMCV